jgi:hypothetical protein
LEIHREIQRQPLKTLTPDEVIHQFFGGLSVRDPELAEILLGQLTLLLGFGG